MNQTAKNVSTQAAAEARVLNGVDLDALSATVTAMKNEPELGISRFRASNTWLSGNHNRSTVKGFYGAKQEIAHKQIFTLDADEPRILAGNDEGANPVEHLLHALASCLTTSIVAHASVKGIEIEELEAELEGDIDLRGFLGLASDVPKGYTEIRARYRVKADPRDLPMIRQLARFSPVFNTITNSAPVDVQVELK